MTYFVTLATRSEGNVRKMENEEAVLLHNNAPAHRSVLVQYFLANNNVTTLEHAPYFPALDPAYLQLLPRMKLALERRSFCDVTDIIKNATKELKKL